MMSCTQCVRVCVHHSVVPVAIMSNVNMSHMLVNQEGSGRVGWVKCWLFFHVPLLTSMDSGTIAETSLKRKSYKFKYFYISIYFISFSQIHAFLIN